MKIFLSWSGDTSRQIAEAFYNWVPLLFESVDLFLSPNDIQKGAKWSSEISQELTDNTFGIVFLTPDNLDAPWLAFEAGAISKTADGKVCPLLFNLNHGDIRGPLSIFQGTLFNRDDCFKLVKNINTATAGVKNPRKLEVLSKIYENFWPELEQEINLILENHSNLNEKDMNEQASQSPIDSRLDEMLVLARNQNAMLSNPEKLLGPIFKELQSLQNRLDFPAPINYQNAGIYPGGIFPIKTFPFTQINNNKNLDMTNPNLKSSQEFKPNQSIRKEEDSEENGN